MAFFKDMDNQLFALNFFIRVSLCNIYTCIEYFGLFFFFQLEMLKYRFLCIV